MHITVTFRFDELDTGHVLQSHVKMPVVRFYGHVFPRDFRFLYPLGVILAGYSTAAYDPHFVLVFCQFLE